jgi:hypothetical protein
MLHVYVATLSLKKMADIRITERSKKKETSNITRIIGSCTG